MMWKRLFVSVAVLSVAGSWGASAAAQSIRQRLGTERFSVQSLKLPATSAMPFELIFELDGRTAALALDPHSVRAGGYRVLTTGADGTTTEVEPAPLSTYRGAVHLLGTSGAGDGLVAASLEPMGLTALLLMNDGRRLVIEPARNLGHAALVAEHVLYDTADVRSSLGPCAADGLAWPTGLDTIDPPEGPAGSSLKLCQIALEADTFYYAWKGSSVPATQAGAEGLVNATALIYESSVGITYQLTTLVIQANPTSQERYQTNKHDKLLNRFVNYWRSNFSSINRDTAHLLTGKTMRNNIAGFAFIGVICNKNAAFGWSWANAPVSGAQQIAITAHELGHNFNAQHCNGDGDCAVMCATIGSCSGQVDRFGSRSRGKIIAWRNAVSCLSNVPPTIELPFAELFKRLKARIWSIRTGVVHTKKAVGEPSGSHSVNLDKSSDQLRSYKIDLSTAVNPLLSFFCQHRGVEAGEQLIIEYLNLSSTWTELFRVTSDGTKQNSFRYQQRLLPAASLFDSCRIRFSTNGNRANDEWFIDDVRIESTTPPNSSALCSSDTPPVVAYFVLLGGAPASQSIQVKNCGSAGTSLAWVASESPSSGWISISPGSGTVNPGEPFDAINVSFNPTGLTAGVYTTMVKVQKSGNPTHYIEVPVTLVVHAGSQFMPGDLLLGQINPVGDSDLAAFTGVVGQKLKLEVSVSTGDLKPVVTAVDSSGTPFATLNFPNSSTPKKKSLVLTQSGLFGLLITGKPGTSGSYRIETSLKNPAGAKLTVRTRKPSSSGANLTLKVAAIPGSVLSVTIVPKKNGDGPFTASLTDPNSRLLFTSLFSRALFTGGTQILQIPLGPAGRYTLTVSGFSAREKITATLDPQLPQSGNATINLP